MEMLGALRKVDLDIAVLQMLALSHKLGHVVEHVGRPRLRLRRALHTKQLAIAADFCSNDVLARYLFGLVHCYDGFPQSLVDACSAKALPQKLQFGFLQYAALRDDGRQLLYSLGWKQLPGARRNALFLA